MKTLGNIIWFIFGGIEWCIVLFLLGCVYCVTIIGVPVGIQLFKMAGFVLWPFGKEVRFTNIGGFKIFLNVIWAIFGGLELAVCLFMQSFVSQLLASHLENNTSNWVNLSFRH